jgi:glutamate synthase domain-containing protein 2/glutamate synthase domain-containing protein 1/glutamate synthase domain-containing protein 3
MHLRDRPTERVGLYDPVHEHDACGVAFLARLDGVKTNETVDRAIRALENLEHRGAEGADPNTGDGAGILMQIPDPFFRDVVGEELPAAGQYGVGVVFLPPDKSRHAALEAAINDAVAVEGQRVVCWRDVPTDRDFCGLTALYHRPYVKHVVIAASADLASDQDAFERKLYVIRRVAENAIGPELVVPTMSSRTIVYKGMLTPLQLKGYFPDLQSPLVETALALVHSRFSTNTFPSWELAHPYRLIAHNGEINTLRGNVNWMRARESQLRSELFGDDLEKVLPVVRPGMSDSATLDNVLELLVLAGRSLPHAMMMLIPESYEDRDDMSDELKAFYAFHACFMEPWDGPAAVAFTDGRVIGATLDRNGLRPGRWLETKDGWAIMGSEAGMLEVDPANVARKGRLEPGKLFLVDVEGGRGIVADREVKGTVATARPYGDWFAQGGVHVDDLPERFAEPEYAGTLRDRQLALGWTQEDLRLILMPMARDAAEPTGSMGNDLALAMLSDKAPPLFDYFKQLFAQVTNPPIDPIRESIVMSLSSGLGAEDNLLAESAEHAHQLHLSQPILRQSELERLRQVDHSVFWSHTIDITWPSADGPEGLERALERICAEAEEVVEDGVTVLILSDRATGPGCAAIPALLATAAVHHHLVRAGTRLQTGLVVETGEARTVHHFCALIGYGAAAVAPYLLFDSVAELAQAGRIPGVDDPEEAEKRVVKALGKGLLKTMSKMGISTISSYCGAQIFEAVGLQRDVVDRYFVGTASRVGGVGLDVLAREALERHERGFPDLGFLPEGTDEAYNPPEDVLPSGGHYQWRRDGERRQWDPTAIAKLQHAARTNSWETYEEFAEHMNSEAAAKASLRGLMDFAWAEDGGIPLDEVEPAKEIVKRFASGAMSLGSLSREAHETLAIAMNRIGGKSNSGEGGEDPVRYDREPNGDFRRSAIHQVASGRFGVNIHYLLNCDELQIKMAQGAKPGEGGQLPGPKVDDYIGSIRFTTPGVTLISPPPHHDIYSIEDLKQLIYDLRCANPQARVSVKLVAEVGVGTVAAGVAKAGADHILISGHDGGTGASPQSSIQSAGVPWEIGLAETQQTLVLNDLRSRVWVQTDGQMKTGRDVAIAALLGADEVGFSTAPLIAEGCIMMRVCHLNTCPVGVATQDPELRKRFTGEADHVVNYLFFVAEETRRIMARLGVRTYEEMVGRVDLLATAPAIEHWKARGVDLSEVLMQLELPPGTPLSRQMPQPSPLVGALDWDLIGFCGPAIDRRERVEGAFAIRNVNRTVGGLLSQAITRVWGRDGLDEGTIRLRFTGSAGQSFGAWLAPGIDLTLVGEANDYAGKGLSGGVITVHPHPDATFVAEENVVVGNTVLYGASAGRAFFRGLAGERFAVRNSGVDTVVEGIGDHGCEYMTGGHVVVLGRTGRNFGAGMSGGVAYVLDADGTFRDRVNFELVSFDDIGEEDERRLHDLVAEHEARTGSPVAAALLRDWPAALERFVKVMPTDYKRVLEERAAAEAAPAEVAA